ncbi:MAG TPA: DUF481 domain-containing protein [Vicinamibacterales bacterium]|nr:DUF481 domain-containing protein [Vicinamibacterales bacterium]
MSRAVLFAVGLVVFLHRPAWAQKTDVVKLVNGDTLTCEIKLLDLGRLQVSTDDLGTVYIEWDKIASVTAARVFRVETAGGLRLLGRLATTDPKHLDVVQETGVVQVDRPDVVYIVPINRRFWRQMDGSFDLGFSYTQSSGIAQLNVDASTVYRRPTFQVTGSISSYYTLDDDGDDTSRHALDAGGVRYFGRRSLWLLQGGFMRNQELGYDLRGTVSAGVGRFVARSNRNYFAVGGGLSTSREVPTDGDATQELEALFAVRQSYFTYDTPKTDIGMSADIYPSLSSWGRIRIEFDGRVKREIVKDFSIGVSVYDSYDSRPPSEDSRRNDIGVSLTIGWTF